MVDFVSLTKNVYFSDESIIKNIFNTIQVKGKKALKLVAAEKEILEKLGNKPSLFTVWLQYSWSDKDNFYLALPLATGGDLNYHLGNDGYFTIERTRFTSAEIVLGIGHLHSLGIIYRDLKPENILLEETGHARISDMGLVLLFFLFFYF